MQICMGINSVLLSLPVEPPKIMIRAKSSHILILQWQICCCFFPPLGDWAMNWSSKLLSFIHFWNTFGDACLYYLGLSSITPSCDNNWDFKALPHQIQTKLDTWARTSQKNVCSKYWNQIKLSQVSTNHFLSLWIQFSTCFQKRSKTVKVKDFELYSN